MSTPLQLRGGTAGEHETFTGKIREVTVNTTRNTLHVHDGQTPKGFELARVDRTMPVMSMATVTALTADVGPVWVIEAQDVWVWVPLGAYWTGGYRSAKLGEYEEGWSRAARPWQIAAEGGWLNETTYPGKHLLAWAQENSLLVAAASYVVGAYNFARLGGQVRVPDMRNMFTRAYGTDADTANARDLGSRQDDAVQRITGNVRSVVRDIGSPVSDGAFANHSGYSTTVGSGSILGATHGVSFDSGRVVRTATETRPMSVAHVPRVHV